MVDEVFVSGFCFVLMVGKQFLLFLSVCKYLITSLCCFSHLTAFKGYKCMLIIGSSSEILILLAYVDLLVRRWYHIVTERFERCKS